MLAEIVAELEAQGLGTVGLDLFYSRLPDQPDAAVAAFGYAGEPPEHDHDGPLPVLAHPGLQLLVRDPDVDAAQERAEAVLRVLCGVRNQALSGTTYQAITPLQWPFLLQRDESERAIVVCNYRVTHAS